MSKIYSTQGLTKDQQLAIVKALTLVPEKKEHGKIIYGKPMKWYLISDDKLWIAVPWALGPTLFPNRAPLDMSGWQHRRPHMAYTGELRDYQVTAMEEAEKHLKKRGTTLLALRTGFGKTSSTGYLITRMYMQFKTLVVLKCESLVTNWVSDLGKCTNVCVVVLDNKTTAQEIDSADVVICMNLRFDKMTADQHRQFGCLVLEEAHQLCIQSCLSLFLRVQPQKIIALTATPMHSQNLFRVITDMIGGHTVSMNDTMVVRKNEVPFTVYPIKTGYEPISVVNSMGKLDWTILQYSLAFSEMRNGCIYEMVQRYKDHKIIVMVYFTIHAELLVRLFTHYGINVSKYTGKDAYKNARVVVGIPQKMGTGFDEASKSTYDGIRQDVLIDATSTKQLGGHIQKTGRVFRATHPTIVKLVDEHGSIKSHYREVKKWYEDEENNGTLKDVEAWEPGDDIPDDFHDVYIGIYADMLPILRAEQARTKKPNAWITYIDHQRAGTN